MIDYGAVICYTICMENNYTHARTCVYNINYHFVWCVKYRRKALKPEITERLYELVQEIADEKGFTVVDCKVSKRYQWQCTIK